VRERTGVGLECVLNISEGRRLDVIAAVGAAAGDALLDVHTDAHHHRSVLTLAGPAVEDAAFAVVAEAVLHIDLRGHAGVHPRLGAADVIPFVPLAGSTMADAVAARDRVAARIERELGVPCVRYGPERSLPQVRREPGVEPHPTAGICCVGARPLLVAYNLWLAPPATIADARRIAAEIRSPTLRTLGLAVGDEVQVSCNLIEPSTTGPDAAFDAVASRAPHGVARAELVGLAPASVLAAIPQERWPELDLSTSTTIEARLSQAGLDGGSFGAARGGPDRH
jgi:glutamate formiminotransferase/glutamate formiminotransferase/formiminotetrahydrofolate cyclodeaminase